MRRSLLALGLGLGVLLATLAPASAQTACPGGCPPIVTDPPGDQAVTPGPLAVQPPSMAQTDILRLTGDVALGNLTLTVATTAAVTASETVTLHFTVSHGPTSLESSTAQGAAYTLSVLNGVVSGVTGARSQAQGTNLAVTMPLVAVGAVGGDQLGNFTVSTQDTDPGSAPGAVTQDDTTGTDLAPDSGVAGPFTIPRTAIQAGLQVTITGGSVHQHTTCPPTGSCPNTFEDDAFSGRQVTVHDGNASIVFHIEATNSGTDADTVNFGIANQPSFGQPVLDRTTLSLGHGAKGTLTLTLTLHNHPGGNLDVQVQATSTRGGAATVEARTIVDLSHPTPPPPTTRTPVPEQLGFLTPLAKGMGLDKPLGDFAELALLAAFLLVAIVAVYLIMFLTRNPWVRLQVTPKRVVMAPGGTAEFKVELTPRRKRTFMARGTLRGEGRSWRAGLQMGRSERVDPGTPVDMALGGDTPGPVSGTLRIQVPADAASKERETVEFDVVPLDSQGAEHPAHRAHVKVTVEAAAHTGYASARDIQLAEVRHDPAAPRPGATVTTTATIHNAGGIPATLRVVLLLDGKPTLEQRIDVPAKGQKSALLPWTAGAGKNQVKVQVFLA